MIILTDSDIDLICNLALWIPLVFFVAVNVIHDRALIENMADTASRPQTPSRKLFKPSAKTKTPTPVKRQPAISSTPQKSTPQSAQSSKSGRGSPTLFRQSGSTPRLVRKASSHAPHTPSTPSKPAADDIVRSTPLAPLTSKLDAADGRLSEYAASDTTGDTPIGLIDNDVLTPTDTVSRSTAADAPKALSREASDTKTGVAGPPSEHDSTEQGSSNEKSETSPASNELARKAPERSKRSGKAAVPQSDNVDDATSELPGSVSAKVNDILPDDPADQPDDPGDLVQYFSDQGYPEMSEFIKALITPGEDPASDTTDALDSLKDNSKDDVDEALNTASNGEEYPKDSAEKSSLNSDLASELITAVQRAKNSSETPPAEARDSAADSPGPSEDSPETSSRDQLASELLRAVQRGNAGTQQVSDEAGESDHGSAKSFSNPEEKVPTGDDLVSSPTTKPKDATEPPGSAKDKVRDTISGFPGVSTDPIKELPTDDELVVEPSNEAETVADESQKPTTKAQDTVNGFPDVSQNLAEELPTDDDLVTDATSNKVQDATDAIPPAASRAQEKENNAINDTNNMGGQSDNSASHPLESEENAAKAAASDKIGVPDTEGITHGRDTAGDDSGKSLDIKDSISTPGKELGLDAAEGKPDAAAKDGAAREASAPGTSGLSEGPLGLANGSAQQAMAGAKDDLAAKAPQQPDAPKASEEANGSKGGVETNADNMGKPARINRQINIPLPRPERPTSSRSRMQIPEVDNLHKDTLPDVDDVDDPPEDFLDPSIHSPDIPAAKIDPIPPVSKVNPIDSQPPPDLARLANGLGGNTVDDVGNIVDESGKVLGHATGDLPSMIGKKVADNGEVYGDSGELIGFVTENFTGHPPPAPDAAGENGVKLTALPGGLRVDISGNILDGSGNVIGKLNNPPTESTKALAPYTGDGKDAPKTGTDGEKEKPEEEKPRAKFDESGIPADIFLDVKSTPDGIQLTIRIPTIFKQEQRQPAP